MSYSTAAKPRAKSKPLIKPRKPYPDFPLFPHATKRWAKKIRGKFHYFGPWDDPQGALEEYKRQAEALHAGRVPRPKRDDELTVRDLCNSFLTQRESLLKAGELSEHTFAHYMETAKTLVATFGASRPVDDIAPEDFLSLRESLAANASPNTLATRVQLVRNLFPVRSRKRLGENTSRVWGRIQTAL